MAGFGSGPYGAGLFGKDYALITAAVAISATSTAAVDTVYVIDAAAAITAAASVAGDGYAAQHIASAIPSSSMMAISIRFKWVDDAADALTWADDSAATTTWTDDSAASGSWTEAA